MSISGNISFSGKNQGENNPRFRHGFNLKGNRHPIYNKWLDARRRCYTPTYRRFDCYGGRGIRMCVGFSDFLNFYKALRPKWIPGLTLDREKVDGHYSCGQCDECNQNGWPMNCRWATWRTQANNKRNNRLLIRGSKVSTLSYWASDIGLTHTSISNRIKKGWTEDQIFSSKRFGSHEREYPPITFDGYTRTRWEWASILGYSHSAFCARLNRLSLNKAMVPKRSLEKLTWNNETLTYSEWSKRIGVNPTTIRERVKRYRWSAERALTTFSKP